MTMTKPARHPVESSGWFAVARDLEPAVCLFRGLGDPTRLRIIGLLSSGEQRVVDLTDALGAAQSTVSKHLKCLADCGLVTARPVGRATYYALTHAALFDLLDAAGALLAETGGAVAACPTYGTAEGSAAQDPAAVAS